MLLAADVLAMSTPDAMVALPVVVVVVLVPEAAAAISAECCAAAAARVPFCRWLCSGGTLREKARAAARACASVKSSVVIVVGGVAGCGVVLVVLCGRHGAWV